MGLQVGLRVLRLPQVASTHSLGWGLGPRVVEDRGAGLIGGSSAGSRMTLNTISCGRNAISTHVVQFSGVQRCSALDTLLAVDRSV